MIKGSIPYFINEKKTKIMGNVYFFHCSRYIFIFLTLMNMHFIYFFFFFLLEHLLWWYQKSSVSCVVITYSKRNLRNRNKEYLAESTGVVPAKYPPKVKLERISTILECQNWENYAYLGLWGIWGFYSGIELPLFLDGEGISL